MRDEWEPAIKGEGGDREKRRLDKTKAASRNNDRRKPQQPTMEMSPSVKITARLSRKSRRVGLGEGALQRDEDGGFSD